MIASIAGCAGGKTETEIEYKPVLLPVKFTVGPNGVSVSGETRLVTPVGVFGVNVKRAMNDRPPGSVHVIIRDTRRPKDRRDNVFLVRAGGDSIKVIVDGRTEIEVKDRQVVIDVSSGDISAFQLARLDPVGARPRGT